MAEIALSRKNCRELLSIIKVNETKQQTYRHSFSLRNNRTADHFQALRQNLSVSPNKADGNFVESSATNDYSYFENNNV